MYVWMKSTRNLARSIRYPLTDKAEQKEARVAGLICGGGIIDTGDKASLLQQFDYYLRLGRRSHHKRIDGTYPIQGILRTFAFSAKEISPQDPEWIEKAEAVVKPVMNNIAPDCQWFAVIQKDGKKSGLVHAHVVQSVLHTSTLKAVLGRETNLDIFRELTKNVMERQGYKIDPGRRRGKTKASMQQKYQRENDGISWMEELKKRILISVSQTTATGDFEAILNNNGVTVSRKTKNGWTFVLADCARREFIGKKAAYDRFDTDFSMPTLNKRFKQNYQTATEKRTGRQLPDVNSMIAGADVEDQQDISL